MQHHQYLVRFQNRTYPLTLPPQSTPLLILSSLSSRLSPRIPDHLLKLSKNDPSPSSSSSTFVSASLRCFIVGGKGGFGTLLKGQSKLAGAKVTVDFGACRDLSGRRLRHVNDEIKLRLWKNGAGDLGATPTGIEGWHLNTTPSWSGLDSNGKLRRKMEQRRKRELEKVRDVARGEVEKKELEKRKREEMILSYADGGGEEGGLMDAVLEGFISRKNKKLKVKEKRENEIKESERKQSAADPVPSDITSPSSCSISSLSGEIIQAPSDDSKIIFVQSESEFATGTIKIPHYNKNSKWYYEVHLITAGMSQIGWGSLPQFKPDSKEGNGVGDDAFSFGFDGSRLKKFHQGKEQDYGNKVWKGGDILGCLLDTEKGEVNFHLNGEPVGGEQYAYRLQGDQNTKKWFPAFSFNFGELAEIRTGPIETLDCCPEGYVPIMEGIYTHATDLKMPAQQLQLQPNLVTTKEQPKVQTPDTSLNTNSDHDKPILLLNYESPTQLTCLGMDRLKAELSSKGLKCGGSLEERAKRLFSIKGLKPCDYPKKIQGKMFKE